MAAQSRKNKRRWKAKSDNSKVSALLRLRIYLFQDESLLKDSQFGISADLPKEIVKRCKEQFKKLIEARKSGKLAFFSCAESDKLYIDRVLVPL